MLDGFKIYILNEKLLYIFKNENSKCWSPETDKLIKLIFKYDKCDEDFFKQKLGHTADRLLKMFKDFVNKWTSAKGKKMCEWKRKRI